MEMLATTTTVLAVGGAVLWRNATDRHLRDSLAIGSALLAYPAGLALLARGGRVPYSAFVTAGVAAGTIAQLINGQFMVDRELAVAAGTGAFIGSAHWLAARAWARLLGSDSV
jgi:hypothetical protein